MKKIKSPKQTIKESEENFDLNAKKVNILILEDQIGTLESLEYAVNKIMPKFYDSFEEKNYDVAQCYNEAQEMISKNNYDFIFLDHRVPYENQGNLEDEDMDKFSASLRNVGYSLISKIREKTPYTKIIGTSSMKKLDDFPNPDHSMSKFWVESEKDLESILIKLDNLKIKK